MEFAIVLIAVAWTELVAAMKRHVVMKIAGAQSVAMNVAVTAIAAAGQEWAATGFPALKKIANV